MMIYDFIVIIIAILIYSSAPLETGFRYSCYINAAGVAALYTIYGATVSRALRTPGSSGNHITFKIRNRFAQTQKRLTALALILYTIMVYSLDIKQIITWLPSETLQKCAAIFIFFLFLILLWYHSYPVQNNEAPCRREQLDYVTGMFRLNLAVIIPWLLASLVVDISSLFPESWILFVENTEWAQVLLFPVFLFIIGIFAPVIVLRVWGCKTIRDPEFVDFVNKTCAQAKVKIRRVISWPLMEPHVITAGVMGIINRFRYILLTPSIIRLLSRPEMKSVLAHELGHAKHHHLFYNLVIFLCFGLFTFSYPDFFMLLLLHGGLIERFPALFSNSQSPMFNVFFWGGIILSLLLYFRYIFGYFSRNFERQADNFSLTLIGQSTALSSALTKVAIINGMDVHAPNWHHYGISERIDSIRACEQNPELLVLHDRKVARLKFFCTATFFVLLLLAAFSLLKAPGEEIKRQMVEGQLNLMIEKEMANPELYLLKAQLKSEQNEYEAGIAAYKKVLSLAPENSTALNNLAWLYVTAEDENFRDHEEALRLAKKAASLTRKSYILDTLAECYFVNGELDKAVETEKEALLLEKNDPSHYLKQIRKYEKARRVTQEAGK